MRISLIGFGLSNRALLRRIWNLHEVFVSDSRILSDSERGELKRLGVEYEEGHHTERVLEADLIVVSPGIPPRSRVGRMITGSRVPYTTEVEAFFKLLDNSPERVIAVSGTNGKTTTSSMLDHVLRKFGKSTFLGGNNENPVSNLKDEVDFLILELSSFQLFWSGDLPVDIGVLLNVDHDHEDWHGSFQEYVRSKLKLAEFSKVFLRGPGVPTDSGREFPLLDMESLPEKLRSSQNLENVSAVVAVLEILGFGREEVVNALEDFEVPEHRMELVGEIEGVRFYNDSKATNTHAVVKALENFDGERVVLILSGILKERDLSRFKRFLRERVESVVVLGKRMYDDLKLDGTFLTTDMRSAVRTAFSLARPDGVVLLSPAGASFDLYSNYAERGEDFKKAVLELIE